MPTFITFYKPEDAHGYFSNFYMREIVIDDVAWPSTEHYFQAMKSLDQDTQDKIRALVSPGRAKNFAHTIQLRPDWEAVVGTPKMHEMFSDDQGIVVERTKDHFMYTALIAKFTQHEDLKAKLLETGDSVLIEDTYADPYWGNGPSKNGLNKLGRMLMLLRTKMQAGG